MFFGFLIFIFSVIDPSVAFKNKAEHSVKISIRQGYGAYSYIVLPEEQIKFSPNGKFTFAIYASLPEDHILNCRDLEHSGQALNIFNDDAACCVLSSQSCAFEISLYSKYSKSIIYKVNSNGTADLIIEK